MIIKIVLIAVALLLSSVTPLLAATSGVKIVPVSFDLTGLPGQKIENVIKVSNPTDREIGVTSEIEDFAPLGEDGGITLQDGYKYGLSPFISIFPKSFSLKPGELQFVSLTINLPADVPGGARSGAVLFGSAAGVAESSGSVVSGQVGVLITLNILSDLKDQGKLASLDGPIVTSSGPTHISARIQNTGPTLSKFSGEISIFNILGTKVSSTSVGPNNILPEATRRFKAEWQEKYPVGLYRVELTGQFGQEKISGTTYFVGASPQYLGPAIFLTLLIGAAAIKRKKNS